MIPFLTESPTRVGDQALERERRAHVIQVGTLAMFVLAAITAVRMWILGVHELVFALAVTIASCGLNLVWLRRGAPVAWCGHLGVASLFCLLICTNLTTGGFYDPSFAWFYAVPFAAAFLIDLRSAWVWTGIVVMTTIGLWQLAGMGIELLRQPLLPPEPGRIDGA